MHAEERMYFTLILLQKIKARHKGLFRILIVLWTSFTKRKVFQKQKSVFLFFFVFFLRLLTDNPVNLTNAANCQLPWALLLC